jgi:hypothetical protein
MAVPYEACDLPSMRSEYKHPDTAIILTLLSYYQSGLLPEAVRDVVKGLTSLPEGKRNAKFKCVRFVLTKPTSAHAGSSHCLMDGIFIGGW